MVNLSNSVNMYCSSPILLAKSNIEKLNFCQVSNVVCDGSPSRMRMVRRISLGMTTRPKSSIRRTIPVAFIFKNLLRFYLLSRIVFAGGLALCKVKKVSRAAGKACMLKASFALCQSQESSLELVAFLCYYYIAWIGTVAVTSFITICHSTIFCNSQYAMLAETDDACFIGKQGKEILS